MDPTKILQAAVPAAYGIMPPLKTAKGLCKGHNLINPHYLGNILGMINAFQLAHEDVARDDAASRVKLFQVRRHLETATEACRQVLSIEGKKRLGGTLMALNVNRDIFTMFDVSKSVLTLAGLELDEPAEPAAATLEGFVIPLGEFWLDCRGTIPEGEFTGADQGFAPVPRTAAAFVVDALAATNWKFPNERISVAFEAMQRNLQARFGEQ